MGIWFRHTRAQVAVGGVRHHQIPVCKPRQRGLEFRVQRVQPRGVRIVVGFVDGFAVRVGDNQRVRMFAISIFAFIGFSQTCGSA
jgi:hypothetical protein